MQDQGEIFMTSDERRESIVRLLRAAENPVTGSHLSQAFGVTRQVIVSDIAILRAQGEKIMATPRGYICDHETAGRVRRTIVSRHSRAGHEIRDELYTIVDNGGVIVDVTVEHPVYGDLTGSLQIRSRHDVDQFLSKLEQSQAEPLLVLTEGFHIHTIEAPEESVLQRIVEALRERGFSPD